MSTESKIAGGLQSSHELCVLSCVPQEVEDAPFYSDSEGSEEDEEEGDGEEGDKVKEKKPKKKPYVMDSDHRMLLRNTKPLLQSRNSAVSHVTFT